MMLLVSIAMFWAMNVVPGGPTAMYARAGATSEALTQIRANLGVDDPIIVQYLRWLGAAIQGNLGYSFTTGQPVITEIARRVPATFLLMGTTLMLVILIAIPLGIFQAVRQYSRTDVTVTTLSFIGAAMPTYWLALVLILIDVAIRNPLTGKTFLPIGGMTNPGDGSIPDLATHLVLPVVCLMIGWISWYSRYLRSAMLDVIHKDYITSVRAKGISESSVIFKHAFRSAAIPLITIIALDLPFLFAGSLYTETIFGWPGIGSLFYRAVTLRDYPVMIGIVVFISVFVIVGNLIADIAYASLDPRVRYRRA
jgi:peptide/nickel transport system permease protein